MLSLKKSLLKFCFIFIILSLFNCGKKQSVSKKRESNKASTVNIIDTLYVSSVDLEKQVIGGKRLYKKELFTGYATKYYQNEQLEEKVFYINGRREGTAKYWFINGVLKKTKEFKNNELHGKTIVFLNNGKMVSVKNYKKNKLDGVQQSWHRNGQIFKRQNYLDGKENGLQESWMKNGKKFVNYEAKNGRIFGLKRMNACFGLENESIKIKK